uniref:Uncharacterized protein n=1 Tax=Oryza meridionalis TaxID=40149 RepID=A0A0E0E4F2_9ORYZ
MASEVVRRRRIADYLNDGEELGIEGPPAVTPRCPALAVARSLLPRFRWARAASRIGRKGKGKEVVVVVVEEEIAVEKNGEPAAAAVASTSVFDNESHTRTPDLGVGLSLVFLLAKTSDEFNKMAKVRAEMETLLREIKEQVRQSSSSSGGGVGDDDASKPRCNLESAASSCLTDTNENERASARMEDQATSSSNHMEEGEVSCEKSAEEYECCFPRMDVLEEELHAELDLLQVNYGSDVQLFLPEEHDAEPLDEITECREEFNEDIGREDEVVEDEDYDDEAEYNGVNAVELERRLHELLHQRNQERIEELELALKRAEKKLVDKEMEVSMWKDTAKLALRQDSSTMLW